MNLLLNFVPLFTLYALVLLSYSNYSHVRSKVDTGLAANKPVIQPSSRPPLRREESTGALAARATARTKVRIYLFKQAFFLYVLVCKYVFIKI